MWAATGWVIATWLRVTLILTAVIAVAWLALGTTPAPSGCSASPPSSLSSTCLANSCGSEWEAGLRWWRTR